MKTFRFLLFAFVLALLAFLIIKSVEDHYHMAHTDLKIIKEETR